MFICLPFTLYLLILWNDLIFPVLLEDRSNVYRVQWIPENAVRDHPAIGQEDIRTELHCDHLVIHLDDDAADPAAHTFLIFFMITINFNCIANLKIMCKARSLHISILRHTHSF